MTSSTSSKMTALFFAVLALPLAQAYFILNHAPLVRTRLDPVVSPGAVSQHEHNIVGGSNFSPTYVYEDSLAGKCTTAEVSVDKSNYWAPQLYYYEPVAGTFQAIPSYTKTYYLQRPGNKNEPIMAFPPGLRMIAGDPYRRTYDSSSFADQAVSFVCLDYYNSHTGDPAWEQTSAGFFKQNCPDGLRTQVFFPSCWNGVDLDSADHKSHMAYPIDNYEGGNCPSTHPVHLVSLFYEFVWSVGDFPFNEDGVPSWVLANGDTTGLGFHGDFTNGWPSGNTTEGNLLQNALDTCGLETGGDVNACEVFQPFIDTDAAAACQPQGSVVDEPNGWGTPISKLPGDNPIWSTNTTTKPSTPGYTSNVTYTGTSSVLPTGWTTLGCIAEPSGARALVASELVASNMTLAVCAAYCQTLGLAYSGVEYGDECYCDSELRNGANATFISDDLCSVKCPGLATENCGGSSRLTLSYNPANVAAAPTLPTGWTASGCRTDATSGRALPNATMASKSMDVATCVNFCVSKGFTSAGIEYASECWCGNGFRSSSAVAPESECNMACAGDLTQTCGGSNRLTTFSGPAVVASSSIVASSSVIPSASSIARSASSAIAGSSSASAGKSSSAVLGSSSSVGASSSAIVVASSPSVSSSSARVASSSAVLSSSASSAPSSSSSSAFASSAAAASSSASSSASLSPSSSVVSSASSIFASLTSSQKAASSSASSSAISSSAVSSSAVPTSSAIPTTSSKASSTKISSSTISSSASSTSISSSTSTTASSTKVFSSAVVVAAAAATPKVILEGWSNVGCIAEASSGRAFVAGYKADTVNMTLTACATFCDGLELPYAGIEYGQECYCGAQASNGASLTYLAASECSMACTGDKTEKCGGSNRLTVLFNTDLVPAPPSLPIGWSATGCRTEVTNARALAGATQSGKTTTIESCVDFCNTKGYSIAGIEYGQECYCGNAYASGSVVAPETQCNMPCRGQLSTMCGGSSRLSTYAKANTTATAVTKKRGIWASSRLV